MPHLISPGIYWETPEGPIRASKQLSQPVPVEYVSAFRQSESSDHMYEASIEEIYNEIYKFTTDFKRSNAWEPLTLHKPSDITRAQKIIISKQGSPRILLVI